MGTGSVKDRFGRGNSCCRRCLSPFSVMGSGEESVVGVRRVWLDLSRFLCELGEDTGLLGLGNWVSQLVSSALYRPKTDSQ